MRLIDADKLIEKLRDFKEWERDDGRPIHTMSEIQRIDRCINFAQMEPTVYDIDKVVEQLEEKCFSPQDYAGYAIDIETAIEIVKAGGIVSVSKPKTNADRIRSMPDEELADWISNMCNFKKDDELYKSIYNLDTEKEEEIPDSYGDLLNWLQSEAGGTTTDMENLDVRR